MEFPISNFHTIENPLTILLLLLAGRTFHAKVLLVTSGINQSITMYTYRRRINKTVHDVLLLETTPCLEQARLFNDDGLIPHLGRLSYPAVLANRRRRKRERGRDKRER